MLQKPICVSIAFNYHDSSISLSSGEKILCVVEAERIFRRKKCNCSPRQMDMLLAEVLGIYDLLVDEVDRWVVGSLNNPYGLTAPQETTADVKMPILGKSRTCTLFNHHYAHAGSFLLSPFSRSLISSCDGGGDYGQRVAFYQGNELSIEPLRIDPQECTSTKPYGQSAAFLFQIPFCEGRLMALASYGEPSGRYHDIIVPLFTQLRNCKYQDGQELLNNVIPELRGVGKIDPLRAADFCASLQKHFEDRRLDDLAKEVAKTGNRSVIIAGGSGLNLGLNTRIYDSITSDLFILPCCDDTGIALCQNAIAIAEMCGKRPHIDLPFCGVHDYNRWCYYPQYLLDTTTCDLESIARAIVGGQIVLMHSGRPEIGPRALGHRSFLMSAADNHNRHILSVQIKRRETFRPLAPIILREDVAEYFNGPVTSPFMLFSYQAKQKAREMLPAALHIDGSARIQTVEAETDSAMHSLLCMVKDMTGVGAILNTSLNLQNEPIANDLQDTLSISRRIHYDHCVAVL